jgi:prevent-host-death family protein
MLTTNPSHLDSVGLFQAKTHLRQLLERGARGESITITKHGRRVAILVPAEGKVRKDARQIAQEYFAMSPKVRLGKGVTIKNLIEEGRKR